MKIVLPCWGLGNVMFQYAFLCELRFRGREACCFLLHKKLRFEHNGYELDKLFKVNAARKSKVDDNTAKMQSIKQLGV